MSPNSQSKIHFVGIGGSGMSAIAELAHKSSYIVSGSDISQNEEIKRLIALGITIFSEHHSKHIENLDKIIVSSAIPKDNPEVIAANKLNIPVLHRSEFLAELMEPFKSIAIAGSHGKTTTSAMIAHMLVSLGEDPTFAIGGKIPTIDSSCRKGEGRYFVAEADESDGSFLNYCPYLGIITNIGNDHLNYYKTQESIHKHFVKFGKNVHEDGMLILGWDDPGCKNLKDDFPNKILSYGFGIGCDVRCFEYSSAGGSNHFKAMVGREMVNCTVPLPGAHNIQNALCCLAVAKYLDLDLHAAAKSIESFPGVKRRFEKVFQSDDLIIVDDYAHNPDKIQSCIAGIKEAWPNHKLIACFQPHRYSRLESLYDDFVTSFSKCDKLIALPVYSAGEDHIEGFEVENIAKSIEASSFVSTIACHDFKEAKEAMLKEQCFLTVFLTVGAGDVFEISQSLAKEF